VRIPFTKTFQEQPRRRRARPVLGKPRIHGGDYPRVRVGATNRRVPTILWSRNGATACETLQWLARQPWFDGRLGMWGVIRVRILAMGTRGSEPARSHGAHDPDREHRLSPDVPSGRRVLAGVGVVLGGAQPRREGTKIRRSTRSERGFNGFPLIEADDRAVGDVPFSMIGRRIRNSMLIGSNRRREPRADDQVPRASDGRLVRTRSFPTQLRDFENPAPRRPIRAWPAKAASSSAPGPMPIPCDFPTARPRAITGPPASPEPPIVRPPSSRDGQ